MPYWACAQIEPFRERLAAHCLGLNGFEIYCPRLREQIRIRGRKIVRTPLLFPGYAFVLVAASAGGRGAFRRSAQREYPARCCCR